MSDSGFSSQPPGPKGPEQTGRSTASSEPNARIVNTPKDLRDVSNRIRVRGEVTGQNRDGSTRIRTDHGNIDVKFHNRNLTPPPAGQAVEVQVPAGRPPQAVRVEIPVEERHQQAQPSVTPQQQGPTSDAQYLPPVRPSATPVDVRLPQTQAAPETQGNPFIANTTPTTLASTPPVFEPLRIEPLSPEQVLTLVTSPLEIVTSSLTEFPQIQAQNIAVSVALEGVKALSELLSATPPATPQATTPIFEALQTQEFAVLRPENTFNSPAPQSFTETLPVVAFFEPAPITVQTEIQAPAAPNAPPNTLAADVTTLAQSFFTEQAKPITPLQILKISIDLTVPRTEIESTTPLLIQPQITGVAQIVDIAAPKPDLATNISLDTNSPPPGNTAPAIPNAQTENIITLNQKATEITASLVAHTPENLPVFSFFSPPTADQIYFIVHAPAEHLPIGTTVTLAPDVTAPAVQISTGVLQQAVPLPSFFLTPETWPVMDEILQTLQRTAPQTAQAMTNVTPSPSNPAQLGTAALFFIAAIKGGDLSQWLGDRASDALRQAGKGGLLSRLGMEGEALSNLSREPVSQDWRALSLPMVWENEIQKIALYYKHDEQNDEEEQNGAKGTRFVFDLQLDNMGSVQLDGWFKDKRLDLVVRTENAFSQAARQTMRTLYASALRQTQISGELSFHNEPDGWVKITPDERNLGVSV